MKLPPLGGIHATYCRGQLHHGTLDSAFAEVKNSIVVLRGSGAVVKVLVGQSLRAEAERVAVQGSAKRFVRSCEKFLPALA